MDQLAGGTGEPAGWRPLFERLRRRAPGDEAAVLAAYRAELTRAAEFTRTWDLDVGTFVAISVGCKDGVRVGDEYDLSRGGGYVGRIQIIRVSEDSSYGRTARRWRHSLVEVGDRVWAE